MEPRRVHHLHAASLALLTGTTTVAAHAQAGGALTPTSAGRLAGSLLLLTLLARLLPRRTACTLPLLVAGQLAGHLAQMPTPGAAHWRTTATSYACGERVADATGHALSMGGMHQMGHGGDAMMATASSACHPVPLVASSPGLLHHLLGMGTAMLAWHLAAALTSAVLLAAGGQLLTRLAAWLRRLPRLLAPLLVRGTHRAPQPWRALLLPRDVALLGPGRRGPPRTGALGHAAIGRA